LTVTDDTNQRAQTTNSVPVGTGNPVVVVTFSPTTPSHGTAVSFDASSTTFSGGATGVKYVWSFGDGGTTTTTTATTTHSFTAAGTYTVTVTVTDSSSPGRSGVGSVTVPIS
jgi:PKD repeat protein